MEVRKEDLMFASPLLTVLLRQAETEFTNAIKYLPQVPGDSRKLVLRFLTVCAGLPLLSPSGICRVPAGKLEAGGASLCAPSCPDPPAGFRGL